MLSKGLQSYMHGANLNNLNLLFSFFSWRKSKGKPNGKKPVPEEKKLYLEPEYTKSRITDFEFKELVMLPREIDLNEWLASNSKYWDTAISWSLFIMLLGIKK